MIFLAKAKQKSRPPSGLLASGRSRTKKYTYTYYDYSLLAVIIILICFGLVMLYSTSAYMAEVQHSNDMYYFKKQALISAGSIVMAIVISRFDYHYLAIFADLGYMAAIFLMVLVKTPLGVTANGARRWLKIGPVQFQPAEVAKIAVILWLSCAIVKMGRKVKTLKGGMILMGAGVAQAFVAFVFTDNLSTAIIIFGITMGMIFIAKPGYRWFIIVMAAGIGCVVLMVLFIDHFMAGSSDFRVLRVLSWLHPEDYASSESYQTLQALYAIGSGGLLGRGLGNSIQKLGSVPEAQNDFIFSIICEELGIVGGLIVLLLFAYLLYRLFFIAQNASDLFGSLLVTGIFIHIALQVILNIGVVVALLPNTGVTLPFISYGGTSVLFLMAEMGVALSVARHIKIQQPALL